MIQSPVPCQECLEGRHRLCESPNILVTIASPRDGPESKMCCDERVCWTYLVDGEPEEGHLPARRTPSGEDLSSWFTR